MKISIQPSAVADLKVGFRFYEKQQPGLGSYFLDSLYSDIDSLVLYAGILHGDGQGCVIPQGATGDGALLERLQQLPDFDNEKFMDAMASTSEATFEIWRKNNNTEQDVGGQPATPPRVED